ncbi:hypothetical protein [Actinomyces oris]|uniref:hypothetical protein n=1 Tax=Actinomyces oris TaxID=544580 RepID=UPI001C4AB42E|nr:hypothetical protein [Actinomyces oris]
MMTCSVLVGLIGTALIGFTAFLVTVAIQRGTLAQIGAVSAAAAVAVIGLLLLGIEAGNARTHTIVSPAGGDPSQTDRGRRDADRRTDRRHGSPEPPNPPITDKSV